LDLGLDRRFVARRVALGLPGDRWGDRRGLADRRGRVLAAQDPTVAIGAHASAALRRAPRDLGLLGPDRVVALAGLALLPAADRLGAPAVLEAGIAGRRVGDRRALFFLFDVADRGHELAGPSSIGALRIVHAIAEVVIVAVARTHVPALRADVGRRGAHVEVIPAGLAGRTLAQAHGPVPHPEATGDGRKLGQVGEALALAVSAANFFGITAPRALAKLDVGQRGRGVVI